MPSARARTWLRRALLAVLSLWFFYLLPVNLFLNTPLASRVINRKPERFHVDWELALSPWPGLVHMRGVHLNGASRAILWGADLDAITASFRIRPLFSRTVHMKWVRAKGADYRQRGRPSGTEPDPFEADLPPLAPPPAPSGPTEAVTPKPPRPPWRIVADHIDCGLRRIWIERYRTEGTMRAVTGLDMTVHGPVALGDVHFEAADGTMRAGEEPIFDGLRMRIDAHLDPFTPKGRTPVEILRAISGDIEIEADEATFGFMTAYFRKAPWLHFDGTGALRMTLRLDHGTLSPGTYFRVDRDRIDGRFLDRHVTGSGSIEGSVAVEEGKPASRVTVHFTEFQAAEIGVEKPFVLGKDLKVVVTSTALDLTDPFTHMKVVIELSEARVTSLLFYNRYLPEKSGLKILSGTGRLSYRFEGSHEEHSLHGEIRLAMDNTKVKFHDMTLAGDLTIAARLKDANKADRSFDISGTRIDLAHAEPPWKARIDFPLARMWFTTPARVETRVHMSMQDTSPLVKLFDAHHDVPGWVERMMTIENVAGDAKLSMHEKAIEVTDLEITGDGLRALADLSLAGADRNGILYVRFHGISLGVEKAGDKKDLKILRPLKWFEKARAERNAQRPASAIPTR